MAAGVSGYQAIMPKKKDGHTPLGKHKRIKSRLVPPLQQLSISSKLQFSSWVDERLPEVLWLAIIRASESQEKSLGIFRAILSRFDYSCDTTPILTHSFLASLTQVEFDAFMAPVLGDAVMVEHLGALLLFETLPDRTHWKRHVKLHKNPADAIKVLAEATFRCLDHQSQESTDIRWFSVMCVVRNGKMHLPNEPRFLEMAKEWHEYPNYGDQRQVRPSIRATEIAFRTGPNSTPSEWCPEFWKTCWKNTECIAGERAIAKKKLKEINATKLEEKLIDLYSALLEHARESRPNTNLDARHDAAFGLTLYAVYLAYESVATAAYTRAIGQIIVRVIAECVLTLCYLSHKDEKSLWVKYRNFGTGQIKLSFLKLVEQEDVPAFVDLEFFERLIGEDFWHEHLEIELGNWAKSDLRKMSEDCDTKGIYDKYYSTTSPFVHATWSAVRMVAFETCFNPLHRFHRMPTLPSSLFSPSLGDIKKLLNLALDQLSHLYPDLKMRIKDTDLPMD
jgi:hypothetical protein